MGKAARHPRWQKVPVHRRAARYSLAQQFARIQGVFPLFCRRPGRDSLDFAVQQLLGRSPLYSRKSPAIVFA